MGSKVGAQAAPYWAKLTRGLSARALAFIGSLSCSFVATAEAAWHRRQRRERAGARVLCRVARAADLLQAHHSSSVWSMARGSDGGRGNGGGRAPWNGTGGRGGPDRPRYWKCLNSRCGCHRNLWHWSYCKHCGEEWQVQHQQRAAGGATGSHAGDGRSSGGGAMSSSTTGAVGGTTHNSMPSATGNSSGGGLSEADLQQLVDLCVKAGDTVGANKYRVQLQGVQAAASGSPQVRAEAASKKIRDLEKRLASQTKHAVNLQSKLSAQQAVVQATLEELEATDIIYKAAISELHTGMAQERGRGADSRAHSPSVARVPVQKLVEGDLSCIELDFAEFEQLGEIYELSEEEKKESSRRLESFRQLLGEAAKTMFGSAQENVRKLLKEHEEAKRRLSGKRKKLDPTGAAYGDQALDGGGSSGGAGRDAGSTGSGAAGGSQPKSSLFVPPAGPPPKASGDEGVGSQPVPDVRAQARTLLKCGHVLAKEASPSAPAVPGVAPGAESGF